MPSFQYHMLVIRRTNICSIPNVINEREREKERDVQNVTIIRWHTYPAEPLAELWMSENTITWLVNSLSKQTYYNSLYISV